MSDQKTEQKSQEIVRIEESVRFEIIELDDMDLEGVSGGATNGNCGGNCGCHKQM